MTLTEILNSSAEAANLQDKDQAALELARIYAAQLEIAVNRRDTNAIKAIGKNLQDLLRDLGMTQAAKATKDEIKGGGTVVKATSALEQLRANSSRR